MGSKPLIKINIANFARTQSRTQCYTPLKLDEVVL